ncbi:MAG: imidazole glycerol phosphate synthase subunit HisF [SAR202 cluster bacterium]|nr:imidazole glycerol phosphate synthase subunit HisF [SAR202 cluster bacterium]|tara:strand:+ start:9997 stop:10800 length:804 start_codon:yes stop_codon:yes gene_type:complete
MITKRIIPCLDVHKGRVVKGVNFLNLRDAGDPAVLADFYDKEGADELVFLDITASSDDREIMIDVVKNVSENVFIPFTVGGGIRTIKDIRVLLQAGADKVSLNTSVISEPELISKASKMFGSQCIVVAIDYKKITDFKESNQDKQIGLDSNSKWEVYTHGGRNRTGIDAIKWAERVSDLGCGELLLTSMDMDGKQQGYDIEYIRLVNEKVNVPLIASGGAGTLEHLQRVFQDAGADAALVASIFHFGKYKVADAKQFLDNQGVLIRK